jgi:transcriptional regulator with XRE-family HTH domain
VSGPPLRPYVVEFGRHCRSLRRARGLTQVAFGELSGLSPDTIRRLEAGAFGPSLETICKLCEGFDLSPAGIFAAFELGEDPGRRIEALIATRPPAQIEIACSMLRALFAALDADDRASAQTG